MKPWVVEEVGHAVGGLVEQGVVVGLQLAVLRQETNQGG